MNLIGLIGRKKVGKNTVADMITQSYHNLKVVQMAFADALKEEVARATGTSVEYINEHKDNFRLILQGWGTDYRRKLVRDDYWVEKLINRLYHLNNSTEMPNIVIVTDVRFLNEAKRITDLGGYLVRVLRPCLPNTDQHPSEQEMNLIKHDYDIVNEGSLVDLKEAVKKCLKTLHTMK